MTRISGLRRKHVNKNGNVQKKHTINKIKDRETRYTIVLVVFFMLCFCVIGYNALSINSVPLLNDVSKGVNNEGHVASSSQVVTLTGDDVMSDDNGLNSTSYKVVVDNKTIQAVKYQLLLERDRDMTLLCECSEHVFNPTQIKYSLNGKDVNTFNESMLIKEIFLEQGESEDLYLKLWVDDNTSNDEEYHFHGHFVLKEIKG